MSLTSMCPLDERKIPQEPWTFARQLEASQPRNLDRTLKILFNKGRYFETSIYNPDLIKEISELTGIPIQYRNMIVASWNKLEDFVIAMNIKGTRVEIEVDWI